MPCRREYHAPTALCLVALILGCGDESTEPQSGNIRVNLAVSGAAPDADGCLVSVDGGDAQQLLDGEHYLFASLSAGSHTVSISDVASNCFLQGESPRPATVGANQTTMVLFAVDCPAPGSIEVSTGTAGSSPFDPDGYTVTIDGGASLDIGVSDEVMFPDLAVGEYRMELTGVAENCAVFGATSKRVTVEEGEPTAASFGVACPPFHDHIAFTRSSDIWVMGVDGSNQVNLTNDEASSSGPTWSPDGTRIAFTRGGYANPGEVYVLGGDSSPPLNLTNHAAFDGHAAWSPDGSRIAFTSDRDGEDDIWVMAADGSNPVNLTNHEGPDGQATWSADGSRIAFTSGRDGNAEIYVMDSDGSNQVNITNHPAIDTEPDWSPVGDQIVFWTHRGEAAVGDLFVIGADGSNPTRIISLRCMWDPAWSPDGRRIAFSGYCGSPGAYEILVVDADGSNLINLTNHPGLDASPAWSPAR